MSRHGPNVFMCVLCASMSSPASLIRMRSQMTLGPRGSLSSARQEDATARVNNQRAPAELGSVVPGIDMITILLAIVLLLALAIFTSRSTQTKQVP